MAVLFVPPYYQPQDNNGNILPGGKVYTYAAGTTTPKASYTTAKGDIANTNPVVLDAGGKAIIFLDGSYDFVVTNADQSFSVTVPNVTSFVAGNSSTIDINGLTSASPAIDDTLPIYDLSATANRKASVSSLLGLLGPVITGLLPTSIIGTNTTASLTVTAGSAVSSNSTSLLIGAGYNWSVANGNAINGFQGGNTLPNSATIHFFICQGATGTGIFASTSLTPNLPTGYDVSYRRIFSLFTTAAGALIPINAVETDGGSLTCYLVNASNDFSSTVPTSAQLITVNVPRDIKHQHIGRYWQPTGGGVTAAVILTSPDESDAAASSYGSGVGPGYDTSANSNFIGTSSSSPLITSINGQIRARASAATNFAIVTRGWKDFRRS